MTENVTRIHPDLLSPAAANLYALLTDTLNEFTAEHAVSNFEVMGVLSSLVQDAYHSMGE